MSDTSTYDDVAAAAADMGSEPAPVESAPEPVVESAPVEASEPTETEVRAETKADRARDETGKFAKEAKKASAKAAPPQPPAEGVKTEGADRAAPSVQPVAPAVEPVKAPQSWKPAAREDWTKVPASIQQEVVRRERETATALQEAAESRKFHQSFQQAVAPFEPMFRARGGDPMRGFQNFLQTVSVLEGGNQVAKAQLLAQFANSYLPGEDGIKLLAQALDGQPQQAQQAQPAYRDPRVDQLLANLQRASQQRQQSIHQKHATDVEAFAKTHEFFDDVREDMAEFVEIAERRGRDLSMEDAYNRAIRLHPEIDNVLRQREAAKNAANAQASTQRAKAAGSSIKSEPTAQMNGAQSGNSTLDDVMEAARSMSGR